MSKQDENNPAPTPLKLEEIIPQDFAQKFAKNEFADAEQARAALQDSIKGILGRNGFGDVKATQVGTHKAVQNKLAAAAKEMEIDLEITDQTTTEGMIDQLKTKIATLKKSGKDNGGLTEEQKQTKQDLEQLKKALEETKKTLDTERAQFNEKLTKAQQEKLDYIKNRVASEALTKAISETADKRLPTLKNTAIAALFNSKYKVVAKLNEQGEVDGFELRTASGELAMKNKNDLMTISEALENLYKEEGLEATQKQQTTPIPSGQNNPNSNNPNSPNYGGFTAKNPVLPWTIKKS